MVRNPLVLPRVAAWILLLGCLLSGPAATAAGPPDFSKLNFEQLLGRLEAAQEKGDQVSYVAAVTTLAKKYPSRFDELNPQVIMAAGQGTWKSPASQDAIGGLYESLLAANWKVDGVEPATLQRDYIRLLLDQQRVTEAAAIARRVRSPRLALQLKSDRRFDPLLQAMPEGFDIDALMEPYLKDLEAGAQKYPRRLSAWSSLCYAYLDAGRYRQILAVTEQLLDAANSAGPGRRVFEDPEMIVWVHDHRARAWARLGNWAEAEGELRTAMRLAERGRPNISQTINLANLLAETGKAEAALEVLATLSGQKDRISGGGHREIMRARHISALSSGNQAAAAEALDYFRKNRDASAAKLVEALVREQRFDEAAAEFAEWIADPRRRSGALAFVQEYEAVPNPPPLAQQYERHFKTWLKREDVRAAVDKAGRIVKVPLVERSL